MTQQLYVLLSNRYFFCSKKPVSHVKMMCAVFSRLQGLPAMCRIREKNMLTQHKAFSRWCWHDWPLFPIQEMTPAVLNVLSACRVLLADFSFFPFYEFAVKTSHLNHWTAFAAFGTITSLGRRLQLFEAETTQLHSVPSIFDLETLIGTQVQHLQLQ